MAWCGTNKRLFAECEVRLLASQNPKNQKREGNESVKNLKEANGEPHGGIRHRKLGGTHVWPGITRGVRS